MSDEATAPEDEGTAEETMESIDDAYDAAETELGIGKEASVQEEAAEPAEETAEEEPAPEDPEHIKWAKSIDGDYDKETGALLVDRVAKRAFELNKQYQPLAQRNAELEKLLLQRLQEQPQPKADKPAEPEVEQTEEEILRSFVRTEAKQVVDPVKQQNDLLFENLYNTKVDNTYAQLKETFGDGDDGQNLYDQVAPEVGRQIAHQASLMRTDPQTFLRGIVAHGIQTGNPNLLYDTFASAARNALFPKMVEKKAEKKQATERATVAQKKKAALPKKGTGAKDVSSPKKIETFEDALAEAEREMKEAGIPVPE